MVVRDLRDERAATVPFPPGETRFSLARTRRFATNHCRCCSSLRALRADLHAAAVHGNVVFMLGPAANHYMTVSHASNFIWRESHFRDLIGLMGDGLLTIDGDSTGARAWHAARVSPRADRRLGRRDDRGDQRALEQLDARAHRIDLYHWTRRLAMRIAMRALFGLDPDGASPRSVDAAGLFEQALSFYAREYACACCADRNAWARLQRASRASTG